MLPAHAAAGSPVAGPSSSGSGGVKVHEYFVRVEIYVQKSLSAQRKPTQRLQKNARHGDKRDSLKTSTSFNELNAKKIREKASWLSLSRSPGSTDHWRSGTCKLVEEDDGYMLKVYLDDSTIFQTVFLHRLNHTDIRPVHRSLFDRKDCLGIFCSPDTTWSPGPTSDPLYLQFEDIDIMNIWLALLRSYAAPEVFGRWIHAEGGFYRMWRQIEMICVRGRGLGTTRLPEELAETEGKPEDIVDMDIYCEISVNGYLSGKTSTKRGLGSPDWQERFVFTDMPRFATLEITVCRDKKASKPIIIGRAFITLPNFRRGEMIEGWFPVLSTRHYAGVVVGEVRLKLKVDEEIILPRSAYSDMLKAYWITELDNKFHVRAVVQEHIIAVATAQNTLTENIMELADREVDGTPQSHTTLFRGATILTRTMEAFMASHGSAFLEASLGTILRRICTDRIAIETDQIRSRKTGRNLERNVELLVYWCQETLKCIYAARKQCPNEMREIFVHIRALIEARYLVHAGHHTDLPWQGVSAFLFLRFFVPAILNPHLFGFWSGMPDEPIQRTLTQIAKVVQSLANLNVTVHNQEYMRSIKEFLVNSCPKMIEYLDSVSSKSSESVDRSRLLSPIERQERRRLINVVRHRSRNAPTLIREAIPTLPQMIDLPKHLAVITSIVVRHTRRTLMARTGSPNERVFDEFCQKCLEVEEQALFRVSQLAGQGKAKRKLSSTADLTFVKSPMESPASPRPVPQHQQHTPLHGRPRTRKPSHSPSSAPADAGAVLAASTSELSLESSPVYGVPRAQSQDLPRLEARLLGDDSPTTAEDPDARPIRPSLAHHPRSTSTDSALLRKHSPGPTSASVPTTYITDLLTSELGEDGKRRRKGLLRGFLRG
ncbi:Rho GTPase activation protein [Trametopsis cervina]|nr:Rho GTPase activation protein [Trametopsis cervina]